MDKCLLSSEKNIVDFTFKWFVNVRKRLKKVKRVYQTKDSPIIRNRGGGGTK